MFVCSATLVAISIALQAFGSVCLLFGVTRTMISFGVYNAGASSADSFASKKRRPKFWSTLVGHVEQMQKAGVSVVLFQELHPNIR